MSFVRKLSLVALVVAGLITAGCSGFGCGKSGCVAKCDGSPYCKPQYVMTKPEPIK